MGNMPTLDRPISQLCSQSQFDEPTFQNWMNELDAEPHYRRKQWERAYICQALKNAWLLTPGRRGLGFGVGRETLPALFAARGVKVVATDQYFGGEWAKSGQFSAGTFDLPYEGICEARAFRELVTHEPADMNDIPEHLRQGEFDFVWSANSLDHLGTIDTGLAFIHNAMDCLKPGGLAVHTTEFNLDSNDNTIEGGVTLFRERDILRLADELRKNGHAITLNLERGDGPHDLAVDQPPYEFSDANRIHIRLMIGGYAITSIGLIIRKGRA